MTWLAQIQRLFTVTFEAFTASFCVVKGPAADATDAPQPWRLIVQPRDEDD
jgi:hypothetical protein